MNRLALESPHVKASLLLQAHFARLPMPIADYTTDTKSVLDQAVRILQVHAWAAWPVGGNGWALRRLAIGQHSNRGSDRGQALVDVAAEKGLLATTLQIAHLMQAIKQGRWTTDHPLLCLPHVTETAIARLRHRGQVSSLPLC